MVEESPGVSLRSCNARLEESRVPAWGDGAMSSDSLEIRTVTVRVLFVCTANRCRSPIAAALLADAAQRKRLNVVAHSAGLREGGFPAVPEAVEFGVRYGVDLSSHISEQLTATSVESAHLVLGMERVHARAAVLATATPRTLGRTFTVREFLRRAKAYGPRSLSDPLDEWIAALQKGRSPRDLIGASTLDDIPDPMQGPSRLVAQTGEYLWELIGQALELVCPTQGVHAK